MSRNGQPCCTASIDDVGAGAQTLDLRQAMS
jgi:hypothetical protein